MDSISSFKNLAKLPQSHNTSGNLLVKQLIAEQLDPALRSKLEKDLGDLPSAMLQRLQQDGVQFVSCENNNHSTANNRTAGCFDQISKKIKLDKEAYLMDSGRSTLYHEIGHAIDFSRVPKADNLLKKLGVKFFPGLWNRHKVSENIPQLNSLYQQFQSRGYAQAATELRDKIYTDESVRNSTKLEGQSTANPMLGKVAFIHQPGEAKDIVTFPNDSHRVANGWRKMGWGAALMVGSLATGGVTAGVLGGLGVTALVSGGKNFLHKPDAWQLAPNDITVDRKESGTTILLGKDQSQPKIAWTNDADYITSTNKKDELFAEAVSGYLTSSESRENLRQQDGELFKLIENSINEYKIIG